MSDQPLPTPQAWRLGLKAEVTACPYCQHRPLLRHYTVTPRMALATIFLYHRREQPAIPVSEFPHDLVRAETLRKLLLWGLASLDGIHGYRITKYGEAFATGRVFVSERCGAAHGHAMFFDGEPLLIEEVLGPRHSWEELMRSEATEAAV
jgi:hypothetical protein